MNEPRYKIVDGKYLVTEAEKELRDEFAMAVLTGLTTTGWIGFPESVAKSAYEMADAMMKVRAKVKGKVEK